MIPFGELEVDVERVFVCLLLVAALMAADIPSVSAKNPDCSGPENWAASTAFVQMKNAGITTNDQLDFTKTKTEALSTEKIGKDLYRQALLVIFQRKDGQVLRAITVSDASAGECSMGNVQVFVVSNELGSKPKAPY